MTGNRMSGEPDTGHGFEEHAYDVVVVGAGGAGLRAAIAAHDAGARTAIVCKSLLEEGTPSWPRGASPPPWATSGPRTTGGCTSATRCAAARC